MLWRGRCILIDDEFSVENEMMTAVRKLKRKSIADKHAAQIAAVYK
jgi:long-subunit acyl-CoA synthetase (AMP-forming)